ncbi:MAG: VWA domain-containing protein [Candidatus Riflebacteria bacterium]|nr:VWA domain-containing protein [Candidatus Riflebacteria bacterium]
MRRWILTALASLVLGNSALAGTGTITGDGKNGPKKLNLTVYYGYVETDMATWKATFEQVNTMLYRATDGKLELGKLTLTTSLDAKGGADIIVHGGTGGAKATPGGLGDSGNVDLWQDDERKAPLTIVHELGHYAFDLFDEYTGVKLIGGAGGVPFKKDAKNEDAYEYDTSREEIDPEAASFPIYCTTSLADKKKDSRAKACIMDASSGSAGADRVNFCWDDPSPTAKGTGVDDQGLPVTHNKGVLKGGYWYASSQHYWRGGACWKKIATALGSTVPAVRPANLGNPPDKVTFVEANQSAKALVLDRSAPALAGTKAAAKGAVQAARSQGIVTAALQARSVAGPALLAHDGARLTLVGLGTTATVLAPLTEMNSGAKGAFTGVIDGLTAGASAAIGDALRAALDAIVAAPSADAQASRTILLVSASPSGPGEDPTGAILSDLVANRVKVVAVAVGPTADLALLSRIALATGGQVVVVDDPADLPEVLPDLLVEDSSGATVAEFEGSVAGGATAVHDVALEPGARLVSFVLTSGNAGAPLDLALATPGGTPLDLVSPAPGTEVLRDDEVTTVNVATPASGTWTVTVSAATSPGQDYLLEVLEQGGETEILAEPDEQSTEFPRAMRLVVVPSSLGGDVAGATVTAVVRRPRGSPVSLTLLDDGQGSTSGDTLAGDGEYSGLFRDYLDSGTYVFSVTVANVTGRLAVVGRGDEKGHARPATSRPTRWSGRTMRPARSPSSRPCRQGRSGTPTRTPAWWTSSTASSPSPWRTGRHLPRFVVSTWRS